MQLTLIKTLFVIGTLAGVAIANNDFHHKGNKGGVIKKTILIDGCTGKPIPPPTPYDDVTAQVNAPAAVPAPQQEDLLHDLNSLFNELETDAASATVDEVEEGVEEGLEDLF